MILRKRRDIDRSIDSNLARLAISHRPHRSRYFGSKAIHNMESLRCMPSSIGLVDVAQSNPA